MAYFGYFLTFFGLDGFRFVVIKESFSLEAGIGLQKNSGTYKDFLFSKHF